jgi:tetraacyldisaccharide 4'-kinase
MNQALYFWVENYLFNPTLSQKLLSYLLLPLSALYCLIIMIKRRVSIAKDFHVPIISIGNLIVGGSGKTPITIALAKDKEDVFIILRGYKRNSKGLIMISDKGEILTDVASSGDEAMLLATSLPKASVLVSEDRVAAILKAKSLGAKVIFLDDGFSKSQIKKLDILIQPPLPHSNNFCLPSGPYREPKSLYHKYLTLKEDRDFVREVTIENPTNRMVLVTAISKPQRLEPFIPAHIERVYFPDHHNFSQRECDAILREYQADSLLTTTKDAVKMQDFGIELSLLKLNITLKEDVKKNIDSFIEDFDRMRKNQS